MPRTILALVLTIISVASFAWARTKVPLIYDFAGISAIAIMGSFIVYSLNCPPNPNATNKLTLKAAAAFACTVIPGYAFSFLHHWIDWGSTFGVITATAIMGSFIVHSIEKISADFSNKDDSLTISLLAFGCTIALGITFACLQAANRLLVYIGLAVAIAVMGTFILASVEKLARILIAYKADLANNTSAE